MNPTRRDWFKSSYCEFALSCVEVRFTDGMVMVRDSKSPQGAVLIFDRDEWTAFVQGAVDGQFEMPLG